MWVSKGTYGCQKWSCSKTILLSGRETTHTACSTPLKLPVKLPVELTRSLLAD